MNIQLPISQTSINGASFTAIKLITILTITTFITMITFTLGAVFLGPILSPEQVAESSSSFAALIAVCAVDSALLILLACVSPVRGYRLAVYLSVIYYAINTLMSQIEVLFFADAMAVIGDENQTRLLLMSIPTTLVVGPLITGLMSSFKVTFKLTVGPIELKPTRLVTFMYTVILAALAYPLIYFLFGYYIAWQNPAVLAYYHGTDPGSFLAQLKVILFDDAGLYPFQIFRGVLWLVLTGYILHYSHCQKWISMILVGLCFAVIMNIGLIIPNPFMPPEVRMTHLLETASSTFLWGLLAAWVLDRSVPKAKVVQT